MSARSEQRLLLAHSEAIAARARFRSTLEQAQTRLSPENLVSEVIGEVRSRSLSLTGQAMGSLRSKPVISTLAVSLLGLLFNNRSTVFAILKLILGRRRATSRRSRHSERKNVPDREVEIEA